MAGSTAKSANSKVYHKAPQSTKQGGALKRGLADTFLSVVCNSKEIKSMDNNIEFSKYRKRVLRTAYLTSLIFLLLFVGFGVGFEKEIGIQNFGDYISGAMSIIAIIWVLIGIHLQGYEISLQTKEMSDSKLELAKQAEALENQAKIATSQMEVFKVSSIRAIHENLILDLSNEIFLGLQGIQAYDSEGHIEHLERLRLSGNRIEYVNSFYLELLGMHGSYDLIYYIDCIISDPMTTNNVDAEWKVSDTKRMSRDLIVLLIRNLHSINRYYEQIDSLELNKYNTHDFLYYVVSSLVAVLDLSRIWQKKELDRNEISELIKPYSRVIDNNLALFTSRVTDYSDHKHWNILEIVKEKTSILSCWEHKF